MLGTWDRRATRLRHGSVIETEHPAEALNTSERAARRVDEVIRLDQSVAKPVVLGRSKITHVTRVRFALGPRHSPDEENRLPVVAAEQTERRGVSVRNE